MDDLGSFPARQSVQGFQLDQYGSETDEVSPVSHTERYAFVVNGYFNLAIVGDGFQPKFDFKGGLVGWLEKLGSQCSVHFHCCPDDRVGLGVP